MLINYVDFAKVWAFAPHSTPDYVRGFAKIKYFIKNPEAKLTIIGHTDNIGTKQNNLALSKRRAASMEELSG